MQVQSVKKMQIKLRIKNQCNKR